MNPGDDGLGHAFGADEPDRRGADHIVARLPDRDRIGVAGRALVPLRGQKPEFSRIHERRPSRGIGDDLDMAAQQGGKDPDGFAEESMKKQRGILGRMPLCFLPWALGGGIIYSVKK